MIINANALHIPLADQSVHMIVTSPPYWCLRNYGVSGQLGLERTPEEYIANMVAVFRECWRVLRDDGTLWLNIGDSYATHASGSEAYPHNFKTAEIASKNGIGMLDKPTAKSVGLKEKDLVGIPWRLAFALQQPYEHSLIKDKVNRAWLSGIIDGEGCITSNEVETSMQNGRAANPSYPIILQVRMSDRQALKPVVFLP